MLLSELEIQINMYECQINDLEIQLRTVKDGAGKILQEVYDYCVEALRILKNEGADYICDNTDCSGKNQNKSKRVVLRAEFNTDTSRWCVDCIRRDNDMIFTILEDWIKWVEKDGLFGQFLCVLE